MAVKRRLSDLVSDLVSEESPKVTELQSPEVTNSVSSSRSYSGEGVSITPLPELDLPKSQSHRVTDSVTLEVPKYLTYDRKEARLRFDQIASLTNLTKVLNRKRKGRGERITDNTLIRVAVDLLLSKAESLEGLTEEQIREGLGL